MHRWDSPQKAKRSFKKELRIQNWWFCARTPSGGQGKAQSFLCYELGLARPACPRFAVQKLDLVRPRFSRAKFDCVFLLGRNARGDSLGLTEPKFWPPKLFVSLRVTPVEFSGALLLSEPGVGALGICRRAPARSRVWDGLLGREGGAFPICPSEIQPGGRKVVGAPEGSLLRPSVWTGTW